MQRRQFICLATVIGFATRPTSANLSMQMDSPKNYKSIETNTNQLIDALSVFNLPEEKTRENTSCLSGVSDAELCFKILGREFKDQERPRGIRESFIIQTRIELKLLSVVHVDGFVLSKAEQALVELRQRRPA